MLSCLVFCVLVALPQDPVETIHERVAPMLLQVDRTELERTVRALAGFSTRHTLSTTSDPESGTGAARSYLQQRFEQLIPASNGRLTVRRETFRVQSVRLRQEVLLVNIVAELRGTSDPERHYVVGGHYDSINSNPGDAENPAPGANDDASGTAAVLEACRVMVGTEFAATILFVAYDGEEHGLLGSDAHAKALAGAGTLVDGMITNDIVGNTLGVDGTRRDTYLRCFSFAPRGNDSTSRSLARAATHATRTHLRDFEVKLVYRGDRYGRGGDHRSFFAAGFPGIRFTEPREDWSRQHSDVIERDGKPYGDLPEFLDYAYLAQVTRVNVALLAELASAPRPPATLAVQGTRNAYDVLVDFPAVPGDEVRYEFVQRLTTSADWELARIVATTEGRNPSRRTARLVDLPLDDMVVGVRTVGPDGARSRVTTPPEPDAFQMATPAGDGRSRR